MCLIAPAGEVKTGWMARAPSFPSPGTLEADIAAALGWWREAGVDAAFSDAPIAWLAEPEGEAPPAEAKRVVLEQVPVALEPQIGGPNADWPQDLAAFRQWWLAEPSLDEGGLAPRIAPSGSAGAELMVLAAMPGEADRETLFGGPLGRLLAAFLRAAGLDEPQVYRATVLARHTPLPDWAALERQGMGALVAHHVALVQPKRLIVLGRSILPLCGHDPAQGAAHGGAASAFFNHEGATVDTRVPTLYEVGLDQLLKTASFRARLWKRWLEWTGTGTWDDTAEISRA